MKSIKSQVVLITVFAIGLTVLQSNGQSTEDDKLTPVAEICSPSFRNTPSEKQVNSAYEQMLSTFEDDEIAHGFIKELYDTFLNDIKSVGDENPERGHLLDKNTIKICNVYAIVGKKLE